MKIHEKKNWERLALKQLYFRHSALLLVAAALAAGLVQFNSRRAGAQSDRVTITPIPFEEKNGNEEYNASGVIALGNSRFLFCDNNTNDALFELEMTPVGLKKGALIRRPLTGIAANAIDDLEAMTTAEEKDRRFIFATSSLSLKKSKNGQPPQIAPSGLLRIKINSDNSLSAENLPGFRDWFLQHAPILGAAAKRIPDEGGLNIEGLAWDHHRQALLFGLRTSLTPNKVALIPVRIKHLAGSWTINNLQMLPPIWLSIETGEAERGIRSIEYIPDRQTFLVIVGKSLSGAKIPFELYEWKGGKPGRTRRLNVSFADKMKPEGVTGGTVAGKPVLLFVDDAGGFQVTPQKNLWP